MGDIAVMQKDELDSICRHFSGDFDTDWTCLHHRASSGILLYYDAAVRFTPRLTQRKAPKDRLYVLRDDIVVVRDRSITNDVGLSVGRLPFSHIVSINWGLPSAARIRTLSFFPLVLARRGRCIYIYLCD